VNHWGANDVMCFKNKITGLLGMGLVAIAAPAHAEMLSLSGLFPADDYAMNEVDSVVIEAFDGDEGPLVSLAIEERLERAKVHEEPYFTIISRRSDIEAEARLYGSAYSDIEEVTVQKSRKRCTKRDADNDCVETKNIMVDCLKRIINLRSTVRINLFGDEQDAYRENYWESKHETVCDRDEQFGSIDVALRSMSKKIASRVRFDLAPHHDKYDVRVLESRKGMEKDDKKTFKAAVKLTKRDQVAACDMWQQMADGGVSQISLQFNLGVCAEKLGENAKALELYLDAEERFGTKAELRDSIKRVNRLILAENQWEARMAYFLAANAVANTNSAAADDSTPSWRWFL